ncbi:MAG: PAC2 family protein [Chloroflexi bacterium]|nr:PAC2 family protein [Chloroflexota bacterium]MBT5627658.1 PAC2 family protein [Chloroflexota bacterium]
MKIGDFEIEMPDPPLQDPHCIAILKPWINVGKIVLRRLGKMYASERIGKLERPSKFYDFTRYRPEIRLRGDVRSVRVPNTRISYARRPGSNDLVLLELLEPHAFAEDFNDSVVDLVKALGVTRYVQIGGMYDSVPHSRELSVTGSARGWEPPEGFGNVSIGKSRYQGPTSMTSQISERIFSDLKLETLSLMVHLPLYLKLDDDYAGSARILKILSELYGFSSRLPEVEMGEKQYDQVSPAMLDNPQLKEMVERFERETDSDTSGDPGSGDSASPEGISLSPEIEQFLSDVAETDAGTENDGSDSPRG